MTSHAGLTREKKAARDNCGLSCIISQRVRLTQQQKISKIKVPLNDKHNTKNLQAVEKKTELIPF
jgi:hypothetical protein